MIKDDLELYSKNQKHCYDYLNGIRQLIKGRVERRNITGTPFYEKVRVYPVYKGTCIKTREEEEGVYDIEFWFKLGINNITWHDGIHDYVIY